MEQERVTVQFKLDNSALYFRGLGDLLSQHVIELCSKGNFGHEVAAGIYRALSEQLERAEFDSDSLEDAEGLARAGFEKAVWGSNFEQEDRVYISRTEFVSNKNGDRNPYAVEFDYRESKECKRITTIEEKYLSSYKDAQAICVIYNDILPRVDALLAAQSYVIEAAKKGGFRFERSRDEWKSTASVDEIVDCEDEIVFYGDIVAESISWRNLINNCFNRLIISGADEDLTTFLSAYDRLPDGFQITSVKIKKPYNVWIETTRNEIYEKLKAGVLIEELREFDDKHGTWMTNRVYRLENEGKVLRGRRGRKALLKLLPK